MNRLKVILLSSLLAFPASQALTSLDASTFDARLFDPEYLRRLAGTYVTIDEVKHIVAVAGW